MAEFSVHLGGGLYIDSAGVLSRGPEPGRPVYQAPGGGLPVDPAAVAKAFQGMAKALPDKDDPKSRQKFDKILDGIGMAAADKENLIGVLQAAGAVASVVGSIVPVVGAALAVLTVLLDLFKSGPSPLEALVVRRFDDLERKVTSLETQARLRDVRNQRNAIAAAMAKVSNYAVELKNSPPDAAVLLLRQQDVRDAVDDAGLAVRNLLDASTWLASFDRNTHQKVWPWIAHRLFTFPTAGGPLAAALPPQGSNRVNHGPMVPMVLYAVTSYLTLLRAAAPEFRSTRQNREDLWAFAQALEILAENVRREGLARTAYAADNFGAGPTGLPWGIPPEEVVDLSIFGIPPRLAADSTRFAVGALDLATHDDAFFTPTFSASAIQFPGAANAKQGLMNVRWTPPATLEPYDEPVTTLGWEAPNQPPRTQRKYRITNPADCAKAANAEAEQNYVDLLYGSGYFNLVHLAATLRNEATDPDRSQTVRGASWGYRREGPWQDVTVESAPILLTGVLTSPARRQAQEFKATASFTTQPLGRERKLHYRVWLRTLSASYSPASGAYRSEQQYGSFYFTSYVNDPVRSGFKVLETSTGVPLGQLEIAAGPTIPDVREDSGTAVLKAVTYDWWVPVKPLGFAGTVSEFVQLDASLRGTGWEGAPAGGGSGAASPGQAPGSRPSATPLVGAGTGIAALASEVQFSDLIGWIESGEPKHGQRRHAREDHVHLDYDVRWQADRLVVTLRGNRAQDRNYIVHVVVEETLGSGVVLHTVQRIPVIGQLTYVPQAFLDQEAEALARTARFFRDFAMRYAKSLRDIPRPGGPGDPDPSPWHAGLLGLDRALVASDPVFRELQSASYKAEADFPRLAAVVLAHPPAAGALRQVMAEHHVTETALVATMQVAGTPAAPADLVQSREWESE